MARGLVVQQKIGKELWPSISVADTSRLHLMHKYDHTQIPRNERKKNTTFCNTDTFGALVRMRRADFHKVSQRTYTYFTKTLYKRKFAQI
jgi:hypothetical protein